ncbi:TIGR03016 family PEP-CTERM system-associated outer membrane protein [Azospirillum picis]|uniref:Uncharacterized protein (PEP-CTERM system associated) n=1 Tax=Azospirillum picis TaxID=488438 RepID=A0ABU0MRM1_9PROT|nr:TIGR03016 family PEP-CTERM system-associated outer membrane protein [Azospirillum picis]MBP2300869.1 uncharacterized protein (PEP-CTERM system associated) [Azospirillum picis]MDQ0536126.1 uncharacterized protein (PEP-CTERM system associated) [Azospirillum picis]
MPASRLSIRPARAVPGLLSLTLGLVLALQPAAGQAADVTFTGSVGSAITLSDNIDLDPKGRESSGLVWTQDADIALRALGARSDIAVNGNVKLDTTLADENSVELRPALFALGQTELLDGFLVMDGGLSWQRLPITPSARLSAATGFDREETAQVVNLTLSPTLRARLGDDTRGELRYRYARNFIGSDAVSETELNQQVAVVQIGSQLHPFRFTLTGEHTDANMLAGDEDLRMLSGSLRSEYALTRSTALIGVLGYDSIGGRALESGKDGPFAAVGLRYRPTPRTELEASVGRRFGQLDVQALARTDLTRRIRAVASYSSFLELPLDAGSGGDLIIDPESGRIVNAITRLPLSFSLPGLDLEEAASLTNRFDAVLVGDFGRTTATVGGRWQSRDFARKPDERTASILLRLDRKLSERLGVSLEGNVRRTVSADSPDPSVSLLLRTTLTYEFGRSLFGYAALVRTQGFSDTAADRYRENAVVFGLRMAF